MNQKWARNVFPDELSALRIGWRQWAMQRVAAIFVAGIFLCSSIFARAQQSSSVPAQTGNQGASNPTQDCGSFFDAVREAGRTVERDRRVLAEQTDSGGAPQMNGTAPVPVNLQQDLMMLKQAESELNNC